MKRILLLSAALGGLIWMGGCYIRDTVYRGQKAMNDIKAMTPEIEKRNQEVNELTNPSSAPAEPSPSP